MSFYLSQQVFRNCLFMPTIFSYIFQSSLKIFNQTSCILIINYII